jgi:hypothetical protein
MPHSVSLHASVVFVYDHPVGVVRFKSVTQEEYVIKIIELEDLKRERDDLDSQIAAMVEELSSVEIDED